MTPARQLRFWLVGLAGLILAVWVLGDVLLPFVAGMAIAYFLDPVVDRIERMGAPRWLATSLVLLSFVLVFVAALFLILPTITAQVGQMLESLPRLADWVHDEVFPRFEDLLARISDEDVARVREAAGQYTGTALAWLAGVLRGVVTGGLALFDVLSLLFITPIVAFYLLRDWDRMTAYVDSWFPRHHAPTIRRELAEVDRTLAGFVRGQASVCLVLGLFYAVALSVVGLDFGLVVGLLAGLLSFIPYVGSLVGFAVSVGIALFQFDDWLMVAVVAGIFFAGQAIEGNFLTPKLVGERIGLHPVWVIFALLAGGSLFGFVGVLLAVPVAAVVGVVARFLLRQYLASRYYTGAEEPVGAEPPGAEARTFDRAEAP